MCIMVWEAGLLGQGLLRVSGGEQGLFGASGGLWEKEEGTNPRHRVENV